MRLEAFAFCSVLKVLPLNRHNATLTPTIVDSGPASVNPFVGRRQPSGVVLRRVDAGFKAGWSKQP